jgi:hypothetical protein
MRKQYHNVLLFCKLSFGTSGRRFWGWGD